MCYEDIAEGNAGKWPAEWYGVANDERELATLIEEFKYGWVIRADSKPGQGFSFTMTIAGKHVFMSDEFLDDDEERENPDFHESRYETAIEGVRDFKINGKPLIEVVRGCRMAQCDAPAIYDD